jgi:hypothetical protein
VKVGDGGDLELKISGPFWRPEMIPCDAKPKRRFDAESISRRRSAKPSPAMKRKKWRREIMDG